MTQWGHDRGRDDPRPALSRALVGPVVRLSRRVRYGVAGRIMFANSVMLIGIMVLTTSLLYLQLCGSTPSANRTCLRSAADTISLSLGVVEADETNARDEFLAPSSHEKPQTMPRTVVSEYDFDIAAVVPIDYLRTPPSLGSANRRAGLAENLVTASSGDIPVDSLDQLAASVNTTRVLSGRSDVRFVDDGGEGGGTMYVVTPVFAQRLGLDEVGPGTVVGAVVVGNSADSVRAGFLAQSKWLIGIAIATLLLGIGASWVTSRGLRRVTGDYGANEPRSMIEFYSSVLKAVSEGLILIDRSMGIVLINAQAREPLGLPSTGSKREPAPAVGAGGDEQIRGGDEQSVGSAERRLGEDAHVGNGDARVGDDAHVGAGDGEKSPHLGGDSAPPDAVAATTPEGGIPLAELALPEALSELLSSGRWARDEIHYTDERVLVVNQRPTEEGADTWVVTMRDHTELAELTGELVSVRSFSDSRALRPMSTPTASTWSSPSSRPVTSTRPSTSRPRTSTTSAGSPAMVT